MGDGWMLDFRPWWHKGELPRVQQESHTLESVETQPTDENFGFGESWQGLRSCSHFGLKVLDRNLDFKPLT